MRARRAELHDFLERDGEAVVMAGLNVVRISPLATSLLHDLDDLEWHDGEALTARLVGRFGQPEDGAAADLVDAALRELAQFEIVQLEP